ncbi:MAG: hypothetical protein G8D89_18335 [gamma proteobacterium symbiont of Clathrolucina costata]
MKALFFVFLFSVILGLFSIKAAVATLFLGVCTVICLIINSKVKVAGRKHSEIYDDGVMMPSYDGIIEKETIY